MNILEQVRLQGKDHPATPMLDAQIRKVVEWAQKTPSAAPYKGAQGMVAVGLNIANLAAALKEVSRCVKHS